MAQKELVKRSPGRPKTSDYVDGDINGELIEMPSVAEANAVAASSVMNDEVGQMRKEMEDMRRVMATNLPAAQRAPDGVWRVNPKRKSNRVHGGLEVDMGPGFQPRPPSTIPMYQAVGGGTTDYLEVPHQEFYTTDAVGNPVIDPVTGEQEVIRAPRGKAAARDSQGDPILTNEYKYWLHVRQTGNRLDGNVMSDIAAGKGLPEGATFSEGAPDMSSVGM
jgi:hypothetical protein|tara:strand:+ start:5463 stop:6122 length:660 start_codon:yes stop_codon:yes gene_type:complete